MAEDITTIKVSRKTKERLEHFRVYKRETYEEILEKMLNILNLCRLSPANARVNLIKIDRYKSEEAKLKKEIHAEKNFNSIFSAEKTTIGEKPGTQDNKISQKMKALK